MEEVASNVENGNMTKCLLCQHLWVTYSTMCVCQSIYLKVSQSTASRNWIPLIFNECNCLKGHWSCFSSSPII